VLLGRRRPEPGHHGVSPGPIALAVAAVVVLATGCAAGGSRAATPLRVSGSTTVNPVAADAAEELRAEGVAVTVDTQGGSAGGLAQLGAGQIDVAMSSKAVGDDDRRAYPNVDFRATEIGADAVAVVVRREVFDGGVRSLTRDQVADLFEGRIANWHELGGPDLAVFVYDKEPGRGTREVLDAYLYGSGGKAPAPPDSERYAVVGGNEEARAKLLSTPGALAPLSVAFVAGFPDLAAVALDGVEPVPAAIASGDYPMARPLLLVTDGPPQGPAALFVDRILSEEGQALVAEHGFLTLAELQGR
jgi:phosphate transport system substrate-binding protein